MGFYIYVLPYNFKKVLKIYWLTKQLLREIFKIEWYINQSGSFVEKPPQRLSVNNQLINLFWVFSFLRFCTNSDGWALFNC